MCGQEWERWRDRSSRKNKTFPDFLTWIQKVLSENMKLQSGRRIRFMNFHVLTANWFRRCNNLLVSGAWLIYASCSPCRIVGQWTGNIVKNLKKKKLLVTQLKGRWQTCKRKMLGSMSNYGEHEIIEWGELKTMKKKATWHLWIFIHTCYIFMFYVFRKINPKLE